MLKWTLSRAGMDRTADPGSGRYQIKRASVRVLRTENDKENPEHLFGRWLHRERRAAEPAKKEAARRGKVRCNPFDPRRIFAKDEPESDSGSVYMRLERLPAAVDGRRRAAPAPAPAAAPVGGLRDVTNTQQAVATRSPPGGEPLYGALGASRSHIALVPRAGRDSARGPARGSGRGSARDGDAIKEFTNKPSGRDLRRPVALKGDSPEAQQLSEDKHAARQRVVARDSAARSDTSPAERLYGTARDVARSEHRKPVKKACVGRGAPGHAHTTTGQHIHHDYDQRPVQGALQLRLPTPRPAAASGHAAGARRSDRALPVIHEAAERGRRPSGTTDVADPAAIAAHGERRGRSAGCPASLGARRSAGCVSAKVTGATAVQCHFTPPPPPPMTDAVRYHLTPQLARLDGQHNTSSERGDSGISEGLVSPLSESQESHECWEDGSGAGEAPRGSVGALHSRGQPSFYFSRPGHLRTDPILLEAATGPWPGYPRGDQCRLMSEERRSPRRRDLAGRRPRSHVSVADVLSALQQREAAAGTADASQGSLRRSRSFSDVSTLSRDDQTAGWGEPFAENSGTTVIERSPRPPKSVRFALEQDDPIYHEINGSYAGNDSDALRRSQLYRSYQNIGSVFVGLEGTSRPPASAARPQPEAEETYLVMRSPVKRPARTNIADASRDNTTSGCDRSPSAAPGGTCAGPPRDGSRRDRCAEGQTRGPGGRERRQRETVARLSLLLEHRPAAMESDESADWSLEAVINDTLPRDLPDTDDASRGRSPPTRPGGGGESPWPMAHSDPCSGDSGTEKENTYCSLAPPISDASTLESWSSHARPRRKPPLAAPRSLPPPPPPPEPAEQPYARLDPAKLSPQVDKVTWHGHGRPTVRSVKSRHKSPSAGGGRIWRHPRAAAAHSTPRKRTAHHLRDDSNDFQLGSPAGEALGEALGPGETYCNQLAFARTADSSLATTVWMGLMGRKSRRVISTQLRTRDLFQSRGHLKLRIYENSGLLTVHVMRARKLHSRTAELCNVYVKVSLVPDSSERSFCRTRLVRQTNAPVFDERFSFDFLPEDHSKRLLVSVWHRHLRRGRSELLGCMSFGVSNIMTTEISGWFRLLAESIGRSRHFAIRTPTAARTRHLTDCSSRWSERSWEEPRAVDSVVTYRRPDSGTGQAPEAGSGAAEGPGPAPAESRAWSPPQEASLRWNSAEGDGPATVVRPARRLTPAPVPVPVPVPAGPQGGHRTAGPVWNTQHASRVSCDGHRGSSQPQEVRPTAPCHRAPSQPQEELSRAACDAQRPPASRPYHNISIQRRQKGFGLSLAWTCPPSVVFVEPGQSAACAGLRSGDYVVRMGAENVVLMDQAAGLELLQRQGDVLEMEVYRPADGVTPSMLDVLRWT